GPASSSLGCCSCGSAAEGPSGVTGSASESPCTVLRSPCTGVASCFGCSERHRMAAWLPNAALVQSVSVSPLAQQVLDAHFLEGGCCTWSSRTFATGTRCRSTAAFATRAG